MIRIYNTLTQKLEEFHPMEEDKVSMYVCGPTVYNYIHIGNARSIVAFDVIRRYFEYRGYDVHFVSNFTDVDDKIIKAAKEEEMTTVELADKYIEAYFEDTEALNVKRADHHPRVKDYIPEIISFIEDLVEKEYAYEVDGNVYYRTRAFEDYGKLSNISLEELREGASERLDAEESRLKEDSADFALWKSVKSDDEVSWESPWGPGRPGWHIECSVMSTELLGDTFDIHGGGLDLTFPHHENEIAQTEAKTGKTFANYWMHNGFVNMDDEKMSKSLGNFVLVHELIKEVDPQIVRYFMASAHYRLPINYSSSTLEEAKTNLKRIRQAYTNVSYRLGDAAYELDTDADDLAAFDALEKEFQEKMDDDFNAANGFTAIYEISKLMNKYSEREHVSQQVLNYYMGRYEEILAIFGIIVYEEEELLDAEIEALIQEREDARAGKDFSRADEIRDQLKEEGVILEDTPQGIRWKREKNG